MNNLKCLVQIFHKASPSPTHPSKNSQVISSQVESRKTKHTNTSQTCWVAPYSADDVQGPMMHRALVEQDLTPTPPALLVGDASHLLLEPVARCPASPILCVGAAQAQPCHAEARAGKAGKMTDRLHPAPILHWKVQAHPQRHSLLCAWEKTVEWK